VLSVGRRRPEVWHNGTEWLQRSRSGHVTTIDPVRQVRQARYALRDFIEADPRCTQARPRWNHVVVLTRWPGADWSGMQPGGFLEQTRS
jgi:hypothetical protein